ncbi:MAG: cardiolipin hydrolase [Myxococcota bacterium]|jgi:cardiolipin hydrolase
MDLLASLLSTADDRHLSRGERKALRAVVADCDLDGPGRRALQRELIDAIAERMTDSRDRALVAWLGDALALLAVDHTPKSQVNAWFGPGDPIADVLVTALAGAQSSIDAAVFTVTDDRVTDTLIRRHKDGVRVRLITDDDKSLDRGSDARRLERAGVPVAMDRSPHHFHHKFVVLDDRRLLNGSYNWTRSADLHNRENVLLTTDPRLVREYRGAFDAMWAELGD